MKRKLQSDPKIKQFDVQKSLYKLLGRENLCIIEDDEAYSKKDFTQLPGQKYF